MVGLEAIEALQPSLKGNATGHLNENRFSHFFFDKIWNDLEDGLGTASRGK